VTVLFCRLMAARLAAPSPAQFGRAVGRGRPDTLHPVVHAKICGITRLEDAELAAEHGAWAIGFILWRGSPRACDPAVAAGIARELRRRVETVGVFVNSPLDEIAQRADVIGFTHVQLHGDEGPVFCDAVAQRTGCRVIKAVRVASGADLQQLARFHTDYHLLDAAAGRLRGGSGRSWDWALAARHRSAVPVILSGGLHEGNVADGIAAVHPWGVDTASGTESEPGIKDPARLEAFLAAVRAAPRAEVPAG
jgi:phosphoribosylanthranilate isomerase